MNYKIKLNDKYVTEFVALPISIQKTVDESLDQANIRLVFTDIAEPIKPLSNIDIEFWNDTQSEIKKTYSFFVSNDNVTHNIASGTYNHELALIELTKWLERFTNIVKANTIPLVHDYYGSENPVHYIHTISGSEISKVTNDYITPITARTKALLSAYQFAQNNGITTDLLDLDNATVVYENGEKIASGFTYDRLTIDFAPGKSYKIEYNFHIKTSGVNKAVFYIDVIPAEQPKIKSVPEVLQSLLNTFETKTMYQAPRFALDTTFVEKYKETNAPEINMQGTLFECLSQIGDFIHCIPRLRKRTIEDKDITNPTKYIITFDELGTEDYVVEDLSDFVGHTQSFSIEQYATALDSKIANLINTDGDGEGSLTEPNLFGWKTPRTDLANVVVEDTNCFIETSEPIEKIIKLECGFIDGNYVGDISSFVYSKTEYDGQLSSISDNYPFSKGFAIYYQPGAKNIYGLQFKLQDAISPAFKEHAIVNIIKQKTGIDYTGDIRDLQFRVTYIPNINGRVKQQKTELQDGLPSTLTFNQNTARISSNNFGEAIKGALAKLGNPEITKSYILTDINQVPKEGQKFDDDYYISVVKTENYNDLIRCDLGLSKNYNRKDKYMALNSQIRFYEVSEIQAVDRQLYYEDYCIIGDDVEFAGQVTTYQNNNPKMTELASGFNAIVVEDNLPAETIEFLLLIDNVEKSITMDINTQYPQTIDDGITFWGFEGLNGNVTIEKTTASTVKIGLVGKKANIDLPLITEYGLEEFAKTFNSQQEPIVIDGAYSKGNEKTYQLPLTSLSFGNAILFHYEYPDNYTVGTKREITKQTETQYQQPYADFLGRIENLQVSLGIIAKSIFTETEINSQGTATAYGDELPSININFQSINSIFSSNGLTVEKDSSEVIAMNYQVNFVTNSDIIIGADVAKSSIFLAKEPLNYKLYLLPNRIKKYENDVDLTEAKELGAIEYEIKPNGTEKMQIKLKDVEVGNKTGESWAICNGNKLIFGKNERIAPNTILTLPFLTFKHII